MNLFNRFSFFFKNLFYHFNYSYDAIELSSLQFYEDLYNLIDSNIYRFSVNDLRLILSRVYLIFSDLRWDDNVGEISFQYTHRIVELINSYLERVYND